MTFVIYHNPRCSTSRNTLQLLRDNGVEPKVVDAVREIL
jgi:arsenate reductase